MSQSMSHAASRPSQSTTIEPVRRSALVLLAVAAPVVHAVAMTPTYLAGEEFRWNEFAILVVASMTVSIALFLAAVPRGGSRTAVVLAALGVLSVGAFWALLTVPLAAASATIALRRRSEDGALATSALGLSGLTLVLLAVAVALSS